MASHVTVIDSTFRRTSIKVTPGTHLSEVRQQACAKFGLNPDQYGLKHSKKPLDLSLTIRLAGLPSGAQLELVQASRSPSVVSVALQLPQSENNARLIHKFPSNTSLWQILRQFEEGKAGSAPPNLVITQRGVPETNNGGASGAGRLYYEMPVINFMSRELGSFADLQKTLAQIGVNSGSALLRLAFRNSGQPLEEAMAEISQYFKHLEEPDVATADAHGAHARDAGEAQSVPEPDDAAVTENIAGSDNPLEPVPMEDAVDISSPAPVTSEKRKASEDLTPATEEPSALSDNIIVGPDQRPLTVYAPPSSSTPQATAHTFNASDYETSIDHVRLHKAHLNEAARNKRLPSDAELAAQEAARKDKLAAVNEVSVRVRLPDEWMVAASFGKLETGEGLYKWVRELLQFPDQPFELRYMGPKGGLVVLKEGKERLVGDLGFQGRMLVRMAWGEKASSEAKRGATLKDAWKDKAEVIKVEAPVQEDDKEEPKQSKGGDEAKPERKQISGAEKEKKLKGLLKGLVKK